MDETIKSSVGSTKPRSQASEYCTLELPPLWLLLPLCYLLDFLTQHGVQVGLLGCSHGQMGLGRREAGSMRIPKSIVFLFFFCNRRRKRQNQHQYTSSFNPNMLHMPCDLLFFNVFEIDGFCRAAPAPLFLWEHGMNTGKLQDLNQEKGLSSRHDCTTHYTANVPGPL
jgi:hypothetical protein